jgi:hypothetical protein
VKNNSTHALFQVIRTADSTFRDIFFIATLEQKLQISGGSDWETAGRMLKAKKMLFQCLKN